MEEPSTNQDGVLGFEIKTSNALEMAARISMPSTQQVVVGPPGCGAERLCAWTLVVLLDTQASK